MPLCVSALASLVRRSLLFFFFQAEDGIRDVAVTGVQTCALPISLVPVFAYQRLGEPERESLLADAARSLKQERLWQPAGGDGAYQPVSDPLVAIQGGDWHGGNVPVIRYPSSVVRRSVLRRRNLADFLGACAALT